MTVSQPSVTRLLATLAGVASRLERGERVARIAAILGEGVDVERRGAAAGELDQLIGPVVQPSADGDIPYRSRRNRDR